MEAQPPPQPSPPHYPDSLDSSPRSRNTDFWDEPYPPPTANKLRLMLSYGGHISPRSHDKTLCYIGGETRIVVVDRQTALSDLSTRFSKTFLNGRPIAIKYQLPNEDLDSLISVTTDEDFENMIEEFDQRSSNSSSSKPSRIRLFLFPYESGLDSVKSEDWLTGCGYLDGGLSESASVNCFLGLDDEVAASGHGSNNFPLGPEDAAAQVGRGKNLKQGLDVQSVLVSPMLDANSSFGSTSSSPSVVNLRPIKVHVEDGGGGVRGQDQVEGIEEQFSKLGVGGVGQKQDNEIVVLASPVNVSAVPICSDAVAAGEYQDRVVSDDERSDHGVPVGYRKLTNSELQMQTQSQPQAQALPPQFQQKSTGGVDLPSPDSVSSDSSVTNAMSRPKSVNVINQDQVHIQSGASRIPVTSVYPNRSLSDPHGLVQMQQHVPDPRYVLQYQFDQRQQQQQALQHQFDPPQQQRRQQQQALQHQFDQQQQQQQAMQHQFDQQQQQQALQHQFDQQQQQRQQQQLALQHQFDQQQQQQALQHQFDQQQQQHALQHQFDQQQQQQALEHQFDQQQQHQQQQALQHQFDQQQQQKQALQHQFDNQQQEEAQQPQQAQQSQQAQQLLQAQQSQQAQQLLQAQQSQQFMHGTHFIHQTPARPVSIPAYYPVYPSQQQLHPQHQYQLDQQYPGYYVPTRQAQAYNLSMQQQANLAESATAIPSSQTQNPTNPAAMLPPSAAYTPMRNAPLPNSEITTASAYRTAAASTPQLVQVPTSQHQQQYVAYSQIHHPSQSVAPNSAAPANYAYNYEDPAHAQIYAQNLAPTKPSQS